MNAPSALLYIFLQQFFYSRLFIHAHTLHLVTWLWYFYLYKILYIHRGIL